MATFVFHSVLMLIPPLGSDEALYWDWSRHLAWGYYTHPPLVGWLIWLITTPLGTSVYTLRLTALLLHLGTLGFVYLMAWELTHSKPFAWTAGLLFVLMPLSVVLGTAIVTDDPLIFFWAGAVYFLKQALVDGRPKRWYAAGVMAGGMMLSKFFSVLLYPAVFFFLLFNRRYRGQLATKEPYLSFLISLLMMTPFFYWNATHKWLTIQFNLMARPEKAHLEWYKPVLYAAGQMLAASPVVLIALVAATAVFLIRFSRRETPGADREPVLNEEQRRRDTLLFYAYTVAVPLLFYLPFSAKVRIGAHWAGEVYPLGAVLVTAWLFGLDRSQTTVRLLRKGWLWASVASLLLVSLPIATVAVYPQVLPERYLYVNMRTLEQPIGSNYFGWKAVGRRVAALREQWRQRPEGFFLSTRSYALAGMLDFYTPGRANFTIMGYSRSEVHGKEYLMWGQPLKKIGANTIYVQNRPIFPHHLERLKPYFESVEELEPLVIRDAHGRVLRIFYFALGRHYLGGEPDVLSLW